MSLDSVSESLPQFPQSYWLASSRLPRFPQLTEDIQADATIVGAGITGITTAYLLANQGYKVVLLDAGPILHGTTGHTTAKITTQHDLIYNEFSAHFGKEKTKLYYDANDEALQSIKQIVCEQQIDCQLQEEDAYIYAVSDDGLKRLEAEHRAYGELGIPGGYVDQTPLPFATKGAVVMRNQAQFNPVPYLMHLIDRIIRQGGQLYEQTTVIGMEKGNPAVIKTKDGHTITCSYAVSASHFPFHDPAGFYFARLHAERSYVLAAKTDISYPGGMYISAETPKRSLRSVLIDGEQHVLIGGDGHKTGQGICTHQHYEALRSFGQAAFGLQAVPYRWSAQDLYTLDNMPYIGRGLADAPNILMATGYRKWGMSTSMAAAILLFKLVNGEKSPYEELFSPSRFYADPAIKTFAVQNLDVAKQLVSGKLELVHKQPEDLNNDEGAVVRINGKRAGAYRDTEGNLHLVDTTCTHMGCEVEWNEAERTWDCPCHGSRFSYTGDVIEGPAKRSLKQYSL